MRTRLVCLLCICVFAVVSNSAQVKQDQKIGRNLDDYLARMSGYGFSGAVIVERNNRVILRKGYGFSNAEKKIRFTPDTPMFVASIQKQFTAAAILRLEEAGKLKITDSIGQLIEGAPEDKASISIHQLLTHTSGMGNSYAGGGIVKREDALKALFRAPLINPIGTKMVYSNDGYEVLGAMVEIISGENLHGFIRKNFFLPAGMKSAGFEDEGDTWAPDEVAHAYNSFADNGSPQSTKPDWDGYGAGSLVVSANDLFRWELSHRKNEVLSAYIKKKMFASYADYPNGWKYGYGWFVINDKPGSREYYHGGGDAPRGFTASYNRFPDSNSTIIIFTNSMVDDVGLWNVVKPAIFDIAFGKDVEMPPAYAKLQIGGIEQYAGMYRTASDEKFVLLVKDGQLLIGGVGQDGVNFLTTPSKEAQQKLSKYNNLSSEFVKKITDDTTGKLPFQDSLVSFEKKHGKYQKHTVLGTNPVSEDRELASTYIKLEFENGSEVVRFVRIGENTPYPLMGTEYPALTPLRPVSGEDFVAYYPILKKSVSIRFEKGENGQVIGIYLNNKIEKVRAKRF